jgi:putative endonuclease
MYQRKNYYLYILSSKRNGTLYIGVTNSLIRRIYEHKHDLVDGFTKRYSVHVLVYYETYDNINVAISREKEMKKWRRKDKINLIEKENPDWRDLYEELNPV